MWFLKLVTFVKLIVSTSLFMSSSSSRWLFEITPKKSLWSMDWRELWRYRDLLLLFVKRDVVTFYKQTVLGPLWFLLQPLLTSLIQFVIFSRIAGIPSDGVPYFLFVLTGNILWLYFSDSLKATAETFTANQHIFGKVYFPRLIMPLKVALSNLLRFGIQFLFFVVMLVYYILQDFSIQPNVWALGLPVLMVLLALTALGVGMIISSLTVKYRDLSFVITFGISLYMYITPIVYPTSLVLEKLSPQYHFLIYLNPLTAYFDFFKYAFLGVGSVPVGPMAYSVVFSLLIFIFGVFIFNRTEKSFIDVI